MKEKIHSATVTHRFKASPEQVFDAWINPDLMVHWLFNTSKEKLISIKMDAISGGSFQFKIERGGKKYEYHGTFLQITRPEKLVLTWSVTDILERSVIHVDIERTETGCNLHLRHDIESINEDTVSKIEQQWSSELQTMSDLLMS